MTTPSRERASLAPEKTRFKRTQNERANPPPAEASILPRHNRFAAEILAFFEGFLIISAVTGPRCAYADFTSPR
jgi:hypothetical protein